jgi:hypothetical protein
VKVEDIPGPETAGMVEDALSASDLTAPGMAVLDTGASESVATPQALQALLDALGKPEYSVETRVDVTFRLADGTLKKPYSRVTVKTPSFGEVAFYILEGGSAPLLLSVKEMKRRGFVIDFESSTGAMNHNGTLTPINLTVNSRGHLLLDLTH